MKALNKQGQPPGVTNLIVQDVLQLILIIQKTWELGGNVWTILRRSPLAADPLDNY